MENGQGSEELPDVDTSMGGGSGSLDSSTHGQGMPLEAVSKPRVLKFEVQLYKSRDGEYIVDVQVSLPGSFV